MTTSDILNSARFRFNSGYHDAGHDYERGRLRKDQGKQPIRAYAEGYDAGWRESVAGQYDPNEADAFGKHGRKTATEAGSV